MFQAFYTQNGIISLMSEMERLQPLFVNFDSFSTEQKIALAKVLNDEVLHVIKIFYALDNIPSLLRVLSPLQTNDLNRLNEAYVLITDKIEQLYNTEASLQELLQTAQWKEVRALKRHEKNPAKIKRFIAEQEEHCSELGRRWIILGSPSLPPLYQIHQWLNMLEQMCSQYEHEIKAMRTKEYNLLRRDGNKILFIASYNTISCDFSINNTKISRMRIGSQLDQFLSKAQKSPMKRVSIKNRGANLSKAIDNLKIPKILRDLIFQSRKEKSCVFCPKITLEMLTKVEASPDEISELLERYSSDSPTENLI